MTSLSLGFVVRLGLMQFHLRAHGIVSDTDGETDLLLMVVKDRRRIGVLIENKVGAPEQDLQAERYHLRGIRSREAGKLDDYVTVICAPQRYLDALSHDTVYQHRFPYERIAEWSGNRMGAVQLGGASLSSMPSTKGAAVIRWLSMPRTPPFISLTGNTCDNDTLASRWLARINAVASQTGSL